MAFFFDDADEHDEADEGIDVEVVVEDGEGGEHAEAGGGEAAKNGEGMDEAFVEDAEDEVDEDDGDDEQPAHAGEGSQSNWARRNWKRTQIRRSAGSPQHKARL